MSGYFNHNSLKQFVNRGFSFNYWTSDTKISGIWYRDYLSNSMNPNPDY
jgi:hypothetical protein